MRWAEGEIPVGSNWIDIDGKRTYDRNRYETLIEKVKDYFLLETNGLIYKRHDDAYVDCLDKDDIKPIGYLNEHLAWLWNMHLEKDGRPLFEEEHERLTELYLSVYSPYKI